MRTPILAGNWKMNRTVGEATELVTGLLDVSKRASGVELVVGPPSTALSAVADALRGSSIGVAAQNMHWEASGAFTGEVSAEMLVDVGCKYVIIAHSERRQYFGETNETANKKLHAAFGGGLLPIYCVGETLDEREGDVMEDVVGTQVRDGLAGLTAEQAAQTVVAYEPVWAIGTGRTASRDQAQDAHAFIRGVLADLCGEGVAASVRIQYGGSANPGNIAELMSAPDIDGGLIGGASLKAESFAEMADIVQGVSAAA
ncbi:triose-phosphate isomerase [Candidatus Poribacteria bacterium]|jgi:triosephosphate isomerase|nr:triose-phosphate isomerase [Candidatus Poribacteria bacterium]